MIVLLSMPAATFAAPIVMVLGDSLSAAYGIDQNESWVHLMQRRFERDDLPHHVVNVSVSGETTSGGLSRLDAALERHRPDIVIIELGANDGLRGLPLAGIERNLGEIIARIRERGAAVVLVGMRLPPNYGPAYTRGFQHLFERLADEHGTGFVPFLLEGLNDDDTHFLPDRLHPNAAAQPLILDNVWAGLEPLLRQPIP